jgi:hypothetical protein
VDPFGALAMFALHPGMEWVLLGLGIFAVARASRGMRRNYRGLPPPRRRPRYVPPPRPAPPPVPPPRPAEDVSPLNSPRLPPSVRLKVQQIRRKADGLMQYAKDFPIGSEELYVVQATTTDYLPATLQAYLRIPSGTENVPVTDDGKTPWQVLWEQLTLIEGKLDEMALNLQHRNSEQLVANGQFLRERLQQASNDFDLARKQGPSDQ